MISQLLLTLGAVQLASAMVTLTLTQREVQSFDRDPVECYTQSKCGDMASLYQALVLENDWFGVPDPPTIHDREIGRKNKFYIDYHLCNYTSRNDIWLKFPYGSEKRYVRLIDGLKHVECGAGMCDQHTYFSDWKYECMPVWRYTNVLGLWYIKRKDQRYFGTLCSGDWCFVHFRVRHQASCKCAQSFTCPPPWKPPVDPPSPGPAPTRPPPAPVNPNVVSNWYKGRYNTSIYLTLQNYHSQNPSSVSSLSVAQLNWLKTLTDKLDDIGACNPWVRREYRTLTDSERVKFHDAVKMLQETMVDDLSQYETLVKAHHPLLSPAAHNGPAFAPWHRVHLLIFEIALRQHDGTVTLPYWDGTLDSQLPNARDSIMWSNRFMGPIMGTVDSGPFADWPVRGSCSSTGWLLTRGSTEPQYLLYMDWDLGWLWFHTSYFSLVQAQHELLHTGTHLFVGGHMANEECAPHDPVYWMHQAFVDYIWEGFRRNSQTTPLSEYPWPDPSGQWELNQAPYAEMSPFPVQNDYGMRTELTVCLFKYERSPEFCQQDSDCGPYLFCHEFRCVSKIRLGGDCTGYLPGSSSPCACGVCSRNKCRYTSLQQWIACHS